MHATLAALERLFDRLYPINRQRPRTRAAAMGATKATSIFPAAPTISRRSVPPSSASWPPAAHARGSERAAWIARGDAFCETVRAFTPPSGDLSEQFDQRTGEQTSAKHLAWSYAAFISCVTARRAVLPP
jgi:glucoamylase